MKIPVVKIVPVKRNKYTAYQLDYMLNGKRFREIVAHSRQEAEIIRAERQHILTLGIHGITSPQIKTISLRALTDNYQGAKKNLVRDSTYGRDKNYFDGFYSVILQYFPKTLDDIRFIKSSYLQECFHLLTKEPVLKRKAWHQSTVNILRDLLIEMFNNAVDESYITVNPVTATKHFNVPQTDTVKFYNEEQLNAIRESIEPFWLPVINFLTFTGLRKNELINLNWENVSLDDNNPAITITSNEEFQTKTGKSQTVRITNSALEILKKQEGKHPKYVFPSKKNRRMRKADPNEALAKALKGKNFTGTIHMFRHTFASIFMMSNSGTIYDLAKYLTHSDIETTKIYAHLSPGHMKEITDKLEKAQSKSMEIKEP